MTNRHNKIYKLFDKHVRSGKPLYYHLRDGSVMPHSELLEEITSLCQEQYELGYQAARDRYRQREKLSEPVVKRKTYDN